MGRNRIFMLAGILVAVITLSAGAAFSDSGGWKGHGEYGAERFGKHFAMMLSELDLSPEQAAKVTKLKLDYKKKTVMMEAEIKVAEIELKEILMADDVDLAAAEGKLNEIAGKKAGLKLFRIKALEEMKGMLDAKQRKKLKEMRAKCAEGGYGGHGMGMEKGMGHGMGPGMGMGK